jgi:predicted nucleic acid-binding protein
MSGSQIPKIYWDSCVFLSFLSGEKVDPAAMGAMTEWAERADSGKAVILTSAVALIEVSYAKLPARVAKSFHQLFSGPYYYRIACGHRVSELAAKLRVHYRDNRAVNGKMLSTPDAIHLASAITYEASEFHTFDGSGDPSAFKKKASLPLVPLSGDVAGHGLIVCPPRVDQLRIV